RGWLTQEGSIRPLSRRHRVGSCTRDGISPRVRALSGRPGAGNGGGAIWRVTTNESHSDLALSGEIDGRRALEFGGNDRDGTGGRSGRASLRSTRPDGYRAAVPAPVATSCDARPGRSPGGRAAMALA